MCVQAVNWNELLRDVICDVYRVYKARLPYMLGPRLSGNDDDAVHNISLCSMFGFAHV